MNVHARRVDRSMVEFCKVCNDFGILKCRVCDFCVFVLVGDGKHVIKTSRTLQQQTKQIKLHGCFVVTEGVGQQKDHGACG